MVSKIDLVLTLIAVALSAALISTVEAVGQDSCQGGRCNRTGTDPSYDCQCNKPCVTYGDCCNDYQQICLGINPPTLSCKGRCGASQNSSLPCQCNKPCVSFGDCCPDYNDECGDGGSGPGGVSDAEIIELSERLLSLESANNVAPLVSVNLQAKTSQSSSDDAPLPLLTTQRDALNAQTIALMLRLYDNYIAEVSSNEVVTDQERQEENAFLDAVFATPLFQQTRQFLISKNFLTEANFRTEFYRIWFGLYSRSSGRLGSSGFEHVFLGELNNGVSGFHNWVYFNNEEGNGNMNYHGYLDYKSFGNKGSLIAHNFDWRRGQKPISSMFVGTSPELELSVFTLCWYARPNAKCTIQFNGTKFYVQTYDITYNSQKYVASSYADISI